MTASKSHWQREMLTRFSDRDDIGKEQFFERYFRSTGLPKQPVMECLEHIEIEYELPAGLLRPEDSLDKLVEMPKPKNIWQWFEYQVKAGDRQGELQYQVHKRLKKHKTLQDWKDKLLTIDDLLRAWCGEKPRSD